MGLVRGRRSLGCVFERCVIPGLFLSCSLLADCLRQTSPTPLPAPHYVVVPHDSETTEPSDHRLRHLRPRATMQLSSFSLRYMSPQ
jgi:hypothetical protein